MVFEIIIGGKESRVNVERVTTERDTETYAAKVNEGAETAVHLSILAREPQELLLSIGGRIYSVRQLKRTPNSIIFLVNGKLVTADIKGAGKLSVSNARANSSSSSVATISENVLSNFPSKVVKVYVKNGSHLKENETLIVLEAMKMEAQIKTPKACSVTEVLVKEGDMVERGKLLVRLKFDS